MNNKTEIFSAGFGRYECDQKHEWMQPYFNWVMVTSSCPICNETGTLQTIISRKVKP